MTGLARHVYWCNGGSNITGVDLSLIHKMTPLGDTGQEPMARQVISPEEKLTFILPQNETVLN